MVVLEWNVPYFDYCVEHRRDLLPPGTLKMLSCLVTSHDMRDFRTEKLWHTTSVPKSIDQWLKNRNENLQRSYDYGQYFLTRLEMWGSEVLADFRSNELFTKSEVAKRDTALHSIQIRGGILADHSTSDMMEGIIRMACGEEKMEKMEKTEQVDRPHSIETKKIDRPHSTTHWNLPHTTLILADSTRMAEWIRMMKRKDIKYMVIDTLDKWTQSTYRDWIHGIYGLIIIDIRVYRVMDQTLILMWESLIAQYQTIAEISSETSVEWSEEDAMTNVCNVTFKQAFSRYSRGKPIHCPHPIHFEWNHIVLDRGSSISYSTNRDYAQTLKSYRSTPDVPFRFSYFLPPTMIYLSSSSARWVIVDPKCFYHRDEDSFRGDLHFLRANIPSDPRHEMPSDEHFDALLGIVSEHFFYRSSYVEEADPEWENPHSLENVKAQIREWSEHIQFERREAKRRDKEKSAIRQDKIKTKKKKTEKRRQLIAARFSELDRQLHDDDSDEI
jgi:hypothetical protein